ncbi:MAG: GlsB/YeaQ/YmgE family stress response membrane protein [Nocardioidaceae bacterium]
MTIEGILGALIIGAIIGVVGRLVVPGKQYIPIWLTVVVGIVAALIGTLIVGNLRDTNGVDWVELIVQVLLAAIGVYAVSAMRSRGRTNPRI